MKSYKSMFYTTLGDFSNCGSLLDFLKESSDFLAYLDLKSRFRKDISKTTLYIFSAKKLIDKVTLLTIPSNLPEFLSPLQHIVFFVNVLQALWIAKKKRHESIDIALTTFSVVALATVVAKRLGLCKKTLLWHWDYMPLPKKSKHQFLLQFVEPLDHLAINNCDYVWYASQNQFDIRTKVGQIDDVKNSKHRVVHWGNDAKLTKCKEPHSKSLKILYMGSLLPEKGLMEILGSIPKLVQMTAGDVKITIAGEANNPEYKEFLENYVKNNNLENYVEFTGYAEGEMKEKLLLENDLGIALYPKIIDGIDNYAHYSDPAKLRTYISYGVPILTTEVPEIYKELVKYNAGITVENLTPDGIATAVTEYLRDPLKYFKGAYEYSKVDNFSEYYKKLFDDLD